MKQLIMFFAVLFVCGFSAIATADEEKPMLEKVFQATIDKDGVQQAEVVGGSYFFTPSRIVVKVNVPVELKVSRVSGIIPHSFVMKAPEAGIDIKLPLTEEPQVVKFTPTKTGLYPFYCNKKLLFLESHREKGMEGILEVTE
jgi:plastocyanin domain-containing protein